MDDGGDVMKYQLLAKYKYNGSGPRKSSVEIEQEYQNRLNGYSTIKTELHPLLELGNEGQQTNRFPLFFVQLNDIIRMDDTVKRNSQQIREIMSELPGIAQTSYSNRLLTSEIYFTNEIEGVKTNRVEIGTIVAERQQKGSIKRPRRLESTVHQYATALQGKSENIRQLEDFRRIYDELLKGEIGENELPDGQLFRNKGVYIGTASKRVHVPPVNEREISEMLLPLISFMNSHQVAYLTKAIVTHFMFENTHPFNDGNGRMGRYLLASYVASKLDPFTGLSISGAIHEQRDTYYRVFREADDAENRADVTQFVKTMFKIIESGQDTVIRDLKELSDELQAVSENLVKVVPEAERPVAYIFAQSSLFSGSEELGIKDRELVDFLNSQDSRTFPKSAVKKVIQQLEDQRIIRLIKKRPLQHVLNNEFRK